MQPPGLRRLTRWRIRDSCVYRVSSSANFSGNLPRIKKEISFHGIGISEREVSLSRLIFSIFSLKTRSSSEVQGKQGEESRIALFSNKRSKAWVMVEDFFISHPGIESIFFQLIRQRLLGEPLVRSTKFFAAASMRGAYFASDKIGEISL